MIAYLLRRLAQAAPLFAGLLGFTFVLVHIAPGDPIYALAGASGNEAYYAEMRARYGLDRSLPEQLGAYISATVRGDLGQSYVQKQPVGSLILGRIPATVLLTLPALIIATALGIWLGAHAAWRSGSWLDHSITAVTAAIYGLPVFWLGQLLVLGLAVGLHLFPIQGMTTARTSATGFAWVVDVAHHMVLPVATLALHTAPLIARVTRAAVREAMAEDYLRTALAKGLTERAVLYRHALANALLPVVTVVGSQAGNLLTGAVLVEIIFAWPGLGRLLYDATTTRDYPVILGMFQLATISIIAANLVTDVVYTALDPRVRYR